MTRELIAQAEALEWARDEVVPCNLEMIRLTITDRIIELYRQANSPVQAEQPAEPVAYAIRSKRDGSLFATDIAIVGWATFDSRMQALRAHPWVEMGSAEIVPLFDKPNPRIAALEVLRIDNRRFGVFISGDGWYWDDTLEEAVARAVIAVGKRES